MLTSFTFEKGIGHEVRSTNSNEKITAVVRYFTIFEINEGKLHVLQS